MSKTGRPRVEIDQKSFEGLCAIQCTLSEIANFFKCSEDTIERWCKRTYRDEDDKPITFAEAYKIHSVNGKISLRRWQFKMAEHNVSMAIWLGKQLLGQKEAVDMSLDVSDNREVEALNAYFVERNKNRVP